MINFNLVMYIFYFFLAFKSKVPRSITTSASSCRALWSKAELMGINMTAQETIESQIKELRNVQKKWNIPPSFRFDIITKLYFFLC